MTTSIADGLAPTDLPSHQPAPRSGALGVVLGTTVVIVLYLLIGIVAYWPVLPGISQHFFSSATDFVQTAWFLNWVPHALAHGLNPFFSNAMYAPTGVNLAQNTSTPLLGWITAPFAPILNPIARTNLLFVLAMPTSATAAFVVLRKWHVWGPAAAIGGLIYGFSPYMVGQSSAHLGLVFVPLPPFIALTVAAILRGQGSSRRLGVQLGLLVAAQFLISPEVLATVAILTCAALACVAIRNRENVAKMVHTASGATVIAVVVALVVLSYPVWMMLDGPQHFTGPPGSTTNPNHNDLLNFLVPGPKQRVSLGMRSLGNRLGPRAEEAGGYIGVPLLILTGILAWRSRRSPRTQLALVLMLGAALLSLGPHLAIDGHLTAIPLPFLVLDHLPLLDGVLPSRLSFEVSACLAAVIAFGLDDLRRAQKGEWIRGYGSAAVGVVTVVVLVATQLPVWPETGAQPAVALPATLTRAIPAGDPVAITYPYDLGSANEPELWQAEDDYGFRMLGGYAYHSYLGYAQLLPNPMSPPGLQRFLAVQEGTNIFGPEMPVSPKLVAETRTIASRYDVRLAIVDRSATGSAPVMELFDDAFGPSVLSAGHFSMWANWHGRPSHEQFSSHLSTGVLKPANDATVSGATALIAKASSYYRVTKVEFLLTDESHHTSVIADGVRYIYGWIAKWNTASVANGTYSLQAIASDQAGTSQSASVTMTVKN